MDELIISFLEKLGSMPEGAILKRQGINIERNKKVILETCPDLSEDKVIELAVLTQFADIYSFTKEELMSVSELKLDFIDANPNESIDFKFKAGSRAYSSGSSRVYPWLSREGLRNDVLQSIHARSMSFTPRNIVLASLQT